METARDKAPPRTVAGETGAASAPRTRGRTYIDDEVVSVIARIAAEEVPGVHKIGDSSLRKIMSRLGRHHGVDAEVGMQEAAVDVEIVVDFGFSIREIAEEMRERIIGTVESMTGRRVVEVNIYVVDVHVPKIERRQRRELE